MFGKILLIGLMSVTITSCISTAGNNRKMDSTPVMPGIRILQKEPVSRCIYRGEVYGFKVNFRRSFSILGMKERVNAGYSKVLGLKVKQMRGNTLVRIMLQKTDERDIEFYAVYKC